MEKPLSCCYRKVLKKQIKLFQRNILNQNGILYI
jgi:hypothetical protein